MDDTSSGGKTAAARSATEPGSGQTRKRAGRLQSGGAIREAATTLFLRNGYVGTSMDEVAALARVSKQTVYTHFDDKERLFTELVLGNTERVDELVEEMTALLEGTSDAARALSELARRYLDTVVRPQVLQLRRLVIGEAARFPDLARTYYERVPERMVGALARGLRGLTDRGLLQVDDPQLAAQHFVALVLWIPLDRALFVPDAEALPDAELEHLAAAGVRVFLAAYGA
jgi:TetR/AcrR family transcriptional regulator, mexJK operon transcriptional repressor